VSTFGRTGNANYVQTIDRLTALRITCICRALGVRSGNSFYLGGSGFALVTAAISWSTTLLPDLPPMSSISFTLTSVSFFASSSAFWLPELCCAIVSLLTCFNCASGSRSTVPLSRTSDTRCPSPFCTLQSPSALRFVRPLLALCGLGGLDGCFRRA
jgi:hypothetical protein